MIYLDINRISNAQYLLNIRRKNANAYNGIDSYVDAAATKGTSNVQSTEATQAPQKTENLSYDEIIKALNLGDPNNRLKLLMQLGQSDLVPFLHLLEKDQLVMGLNFFNKKKLLMCLMNLPKEQLLKILAQVFSREELIQMMPMKELTNFLDSNKIEPRDLAKLLQSLPPQTLMQLIEAVTGEPVKNASNKEMLATLNGMDPEILKEGMKCLPYKELVGMIDKLTANNVDLMKEFTQESLFMPLMKLNKAELAQSMIVLDPEKLIKLLSQLPENLLAEVITLLDPEKLAGRLEQFHKDLLSYIAA